MRATLYHWDLEWFMKTELQGSLLTLEKQHDKKKAKDTIFLPYLMEYAQLSWRWFSYCKVNPILRLRSRVNRWSCSTCGQIINPVSVKGWSLAKDVSDLQSGGRNHMWMHQIKQENMLFTAALQNNTYKHFLTGPSYQQSNAICQSHLKFVWNVWVTMFSLLQAFFGLS